MVNIRRIEKGEWRLFKEVRLAALLESPEAFCSTYESASKRSPDSWAEQADNSAEGSGRATFLATHDGEPAGIAAIYGDGEESADEGELIQVWVAPECRGIGLAGELMCAVFGWAKANGYRRIRTEVMGANLRAVGFYEKHGFEVTGDQANHSDGGTLLVKAIG